MEFSRLKRKMREEEKNRKLSQISYICLPIGMLMDEAGLRSLVLILELDLDVKVEPN